MNLEKQFKENIRFHLKKGETFGVAVSGGVDSMVLLDLIAKFSSDKKWRPVVLHLNHGLRSKESEKDLRLVQKKAKDYGFIFRSKKENVKKLSQKSKVSVEEAGRNARFDFFAKCAGRQKFKKILLAHHQDDLVETMLMRLFRGTGPRGFSAMREISHRGKLTLIRPLLECSKKDLLGYSKVNKLKFREDSSNQSDKYFRNKIRLKIVPYLRRELGDSIQKKLIGFRSRLIESYDCLDQNIQKEFTKKWVVKKKSFEILESSFKRWHPAIQYGTLSLAFQKLVGKTLEQKEWNHIRELFDGDKKKINLRGNAFISRQGRRIILSEKN